jgi:FtsH-binding integral membrane protein
MMPPVQDRLFVMAAGEVIALRPLGLAVALFPFALWLTARALARAPFDGAGAVFYWTFAAALGAAANTVFFFLANDSLASVFALAALAFGALNVVARLVRLHALIDVALFLLVALGGAYLIDRVLTTTWPFLAADIAGVLVYAFFVLRGARGLEAVRRAFAGKAQWNALVDHGALYAMTLAPPVRGGDASAESASQPSGASAPVSRKRDLESVVR